MSSNSIATDKGTLDKIKETLDKIERRGIDSETKSDLDGIRTGIKQIEEVDNIFRRNNKLHQSIGDLDVAFTVLPTVLAVVFAVYVIFDSRDVKLLVARIKNVSQLQDSALQISTDLNSTKDEIINRFTINERDSLSQLKELQLINVYQKRLDSIKTEISVTNKSIQHTSNP